MSSPDGPPAETVRQAADPATPLATLAEIAAAWPSLRPALATNPSTYDDLLGWLADLNDPAVTAALATRGAAPRAAGTAVATAALAVETPSSSAAPDGEFVWVEPTRLLTLKWGRYRERYFVGLGLLFLGPAFGSILLMIRSALPYDYVNYENDVSDTFRTILNVAAYVFWVLLSALGFVALPGTIARRVWGGVIFVIGTTVGAVVGLSGILVVVSWLLVRQRAGLSYLLLIGVLALQLLFAGFLIVLAFGMFNAGWIAAVVAGVLSLAVIVGAAWLAVPISKASARAAHNRGPILDPAERAHAARVQQITEWESAYRDAHNGEAPPVGFMPPTAIASQANTTNTLAILSLVLGGGWLGVVFGHVAHSQIRRTGQRGWGLATAGIIWGYVGFFTVVIASIVIAISASRNY